MRAGGRVQDNYFEETLKMRNLLEELRIVRGVRKPTILGVREHIFTGRWALVQRHRGAVAKAHRGEHESLRAVHPP